MPVVFKRVLFIAGVVAVALVVTYFLLSRPLAFTPVAGAAPNIVPGDSVVDGLSIQPFRAVYRRQSRVFGVPVSSGTATLEVQAAEGSGGPLLQADIGFGAGAGVADRIVLEHATLAPLGRRYQIPPDRSATLDFSKSRVRAEVTLGDSVVQDTTFVFAQPVFEVSVLELLLAALPLTEGFNAFAWWDNFPNTAEARAQLRVIGREQITTEDGTSYDTWVVHFRFATGRVRAFWIADVPPYKIRVVSYLKGRAVTSRWELASSE